MIGYPVIVFIELREHLNFEISLSSLISVIGDLPEASIDLFKDYFQNFLNIFDI